MKSGITVTGSGSASAVPDRAQLNLAASAVRAEPQSALNEVSARTRLLIENLGGKGVPPDRIQTTDLSLWPEADRNGNPAGYRARNGVRIDFTDLPRLGEIVGSALSVLGEGAEMGGISFSIDSRQSLEEEARIAAWSVVETRARQLAQLARVSLGRPQAIVESFSGGPPSPKLARMAMAESLPVEPGSSSVSVTLTVRFAVV